MAASRRGFLRFAEYVAVSASVLGAIATVKTQQPMYAITPLTVVAALSLISHRQSAKHLDKTATKLSQQVLDQLPPIHAFDQLNKRLDIVGQQGLRRQDTLDNLTACAAQHTEMLQAVTLDAQTVRTELTEQLTGKFTEQLNQQTAEQQKQLSTHAQNIESAQSEITHHQTQLAAQTADSEKTQSDIEALSASLHQATAQIQAKIETLNTTLDALPAQREQSLANHLANHSAQIDEKMDDRLAQMQQSVFEQQSQVTDKTDQMAQSWAQKNTEFSQTLEHLTQDLEALSARVDKWVNLDWPTPRAISERELESVSES